MLTIVGGTYLEVCVYPQSYELYGSGLRAVAALANISHQIEFISCIGSEDCLAADSICQTYNIHSVLKKIGETISFNYYHPLSRPFTTPNTSEIQKVELPEQRSENILYYGMAEAVIAVNGKFVVYDPQNEVRFSDTGSSAEHLALILNRKEAIVLSGLNESDGLITVGKSLLVTEQAEVVVIKNGSSGALVFEGENVSEIPVFKTKSVWPIGSGDIFSAVFSWKWILEKMPAAKAALYASNYTAQYCESRILPLTLEPKFYERLRILNRQKKVYLAGPFFTINERWLINELWDILNEFGNKVFSPYHDVGLGGSPDMIAKDLKAIQEADIILAVLTGMDAGTIFEVGYARALGKNVVILVENVQECDLAMFSGSDCEITDDLSTAVYKVSW